MVLFLLPNSLIVNHNSIPSANLKNSHTTPPDTDMKNSHDMMASSPMIVSTASTKAESIHHFSATAHDPMKITAMATARAVAALSIHRRLGLSHNATGDLVFDSLEFVKLLLLLVWRHGPVQMNPLHLLVDPAQLGLCLTQYAAGGEFRQVLFNQLVGSGYFPGFPESLDRVGKLVGLPQEFVELSFT